MNNHMFACVGIGLSMVLTTGTFAGESFTGTYSQDFNGLGQSGAVTLSGVGPHSITGVLGSTGVEGWSGANFFSSESQNTEFKAHDGSLASSGGRGVVFFGTNGSSERALGALPTSNQISSFGVVLTNTSSETYVAIEVSFTGEQWRAGEPGLDNVLAFSYGMGASLVDATTAFSTLDFHSPFLSGNQVALNGNDPANQTPRSGTISGLNWTPGQSIVLRWDINQLQGQDNGLAIDDLSVVAVADKPGLSSIDLADYELSATHSLPNSASEASGVTYNWDTDTLFVIGDEGNAVVEVTTAGKFVSQMTLTGFEDTEGLTYIGDGKLVIVEERIQDVFLLTYAAGGAADRSTLPGVSLGSTVGNVGLEGISLDPLTGNYVLVKEKTPQRVAEADINFTMSSAPLTDLFVPALGVSDVSDVQVLSTVPALVGTADQDNLLIFSQEGARLMEVTRTGQLLSSFDFSSIAGNGEGVTIGPDGTIYVVGENPELYVLTPIPTTTCPADIDSSGAVDVDDLIAVILGWGACPKSPAVCTPDINASGAVDVDDLIAVILGWGECA